MALNRLVGGVDVQKKDVIGNEIVGFGVSDFNFSPLRFFFLSELKSWMCNRVGYVCENCLEDRWKW